MHNRCFSYKWRAKTALTFTVRYLLIWRKFDLEDENDVFFLGISIDKHRSISFFFITERLILQSRFFPTIPEIHSSIIVRDLRFQPFRTSSENFFPFFFTNLNKVFHQQTQSHRSKDKYLFKIISFVFFCWRKEKEICTTKPESEERKENEPHTRTHKDVYWIYTENTRNIIWKNRQLTKITHHTTSRRREREREIEASCIATAWNTHVLLSAEKK